MLVFLIKYILKFCNQSNFLHYSYITLRQTCYSKTEIISFDWYRERFRKSKAQLKTNTF